MALAVLNDKKLLIEKLIIKSIIYQFPSSFKINIEITLDEKEINSLVGLASILSLSGDDEDISLSYEIITRLIELKGDDEKIISTAEVIFSRIGNFPGRTLLRSRYKSSLGLSISYPLKLECISREAENTIFSGDENDCLLTDFQYKFFDSLDNEDALSISAPTSAGKSFVLNLDLVRKIRKGHGQSIVYIVPTRALVSEVSQRIRVTLRNEGIDKVTIRTAPFPVAKEKIEQAAIYVLTQERLMSFINSSDVVPYITTLIVDEAHEIQNGKRGIILQNAIDITLSRFNSVKVLFASPLISNPSYFLSLFGKTSNGRYFVETVSPVSQNLISLSEVKLKPNLIQVDFLHRGSEISIGKVDVGFKFRGKVDQRVNFALAISSNDDSVISFSNGPSDAEKIAYLIADKIKGFEPSDAVKHFADFLKREVHKEYALADCVLKGVAFHYGNMPSLVRMGVESLFKNGDLKIICCTSTLLQGVNLPAKHIIIENPMSGGESPMTRANFLNLAGRAGRLLQEFHGNIWCIRPMEWKSECFNGDKLQEITSAISKVMEDGGTTIQSLLSNDDLSNSDADKAEAAFGKLYHDYLLDPELGFIEKYRSDNNSSTLDSTFDEIKKIKVTLPLEILENNQSLRPDHLQTLYENLSNIPFNIAVPLSPYVAGSQERMEYIFKVITLCFKWDISDRYFSWISSLSYSWVRGVPIREVLSQRVSYLRSQNSTDSTSSIIRSCLKVLEDAIRFKLVKYFSAYIDILRYVSIEREGLDKIEEIEPYHIYLEFGACNRHALNLMALGLSRFTALYLEKRFDLPGDVEAEEYLGSLSKMRLDEIDMPAICRNEIKELIG